MMNAKQCYVMACNFTAQNKISVLCAEYEHCVHVTMDRTLLRTVITHVLLSRYAKQAVTNSQNHCRGAQTPRKLTRTVPVEM